MKSFALALLATVIQLNSANAAEIWDGLPAMEPMHLQGIYTGKRICPMCMHGTDAGLMIFVPESLSPELASRIAQRARPSALQIDSDRFRVFVTVVGQPSVRLLEALAVNDKRWFVVTLQGESLARAEKDLDASLGKQVEAYVFSQRRLLRVLNRDALLDTKSDQLRAQSLYAMQLLEVVHPATKKNDGTPQIAMWFAPTKLQERVDLRPGDDASTTACFVNEAGQVMAGALAQVPVQAGWASMQGDSTFRWARTDAKGCLEVAGLRDTDAISIALHNNLSATRHANVLASQLNATRSEIITRVASNATAPLRVVGLPCEGCEKILDDSPAVLTSNARIGPKGEEGEPMRLSGRTLDSTGQPVPGVIVHAYQTDRNGIYFKRGEKRIKLRGWAKSDAQGRYAFDTIRPGSYPDRSEVAHIHMSVLEVGRCTYYIDNVVFSDDPLRSSIKNSESAPPRAGSGMTTPVKDAAGVWQVTRDIHLGLNVPGYEACGADSQAR